MKGTIITGEEVMKRISKGEWDAVKNIYAIYSAGKMVCINEDTRIKH